MLQNCCVELLNLVKDGLFLLKKLLICEKKHFACFLVIMITAACMGGIKKKKTPELIIFN